MWRSVVGAPEAYPGLLAGATMLLLAVWLLGLSFRGRTNRAFALFLVVQALSILLSVLTVFAETPTDAMYWWRVRVYFVVAGAPALAWFLCVYPRPRTWFGRHPYGWVPFVALALAAQAAYLADHSLFSTQTTAGQASCIYTYGTMCVDSQGPLWMATGLLYLAFAVGGVVLARDLLRQPPGRRRRSMLLVLSGFALGAVFEGTRHAFSIPDYFFTDRNQWDVADSALDMVAIAFDLILIAQVFRMTRHGDRDLRTGARRLLLLLPFPVASAVFLALQDVPQFGSGISLFLTGLWRLCVPLLVSYALIRHQLFDIDFKLKWTIRRGTLAGIFIAAFFTTSELAQHFFSRSVGPTVGIMATGLLVFGIAPLQRFTERLSDRALPDVVPVAAMAVPDREALYREMVVSAWADGSVDRGELALLRSLRDRLGLAIADAERIERDATASPGRRPRRPAS